MTYCAQMSSELGDMVLCCDGTYLTGLYFTDQKDSPQPAGATVPWHRSVGPAEGMLAGYPLKLLRARKISGDGPLFEAADSTESNPRAGITQATGESRCDASQSFSLELMQAVTPATALAVFEQTREELSQYFLGTRTAFTVPLQPDGSVFQKKVWRALLDIPFGEFVSYGDIARAVGLSSHHGRPVGTAVGRNPIAIIIPCHRVLSGTGRLTGYTGGLNRKLALLKLEGFSLG